METKKGKNMAIIVVICSIFLLLVLTFFNTKGIYIQIGTPPFGINHQAVAISLLIVAIISIINLLKDKVIKGIFFGIGVFFILVNMLPGLLTGVNYTTFSSPDNQHKFVVIEKGIGQLYQLSDSGLFMTHITDIHTDDGYKPFSNGAFKLEWISSDRLIIHYAFDYMDENIYDDYRKVSVQYKGN
ncbi:hypothetical protein CU633_21910 [Bacillus sp. V3-13]|uniref:hypothetical protein n=1 Tax=Bacillus sp. V3-13 TaxID=2053728 RepID=UPI000C77F630|nr:hypothetical protein [Bacillus sp. V3-13]PLR75283.1 hypothetical protein CU633_21910 [Bacillus sp. V3-13]